MKTVLVLPGGGIRGYIAARAIRDIEMTTGYSAHELFDLVVGTSTGGILACAVGAGIPGHAMADMYREEGGSIFSRPWWANLTNPGGLRAPRYNGKGLKKALESVFGDTVLGQMMTPTLVPARNFSRREPALFRSYNKADAALSVVDVCMATSAAPTYFPPYVMDDELYIDGGLYANNPADLAAAVAAESYDEPFRLLVLSNGHDTGVNEGDGALGWGMIRWAPAVVGEFMDSGQDVSMHVARLLAHGRLVHAHPGPVAVDMDDTSDEAFDRMYDAYEDHMRPVVMRVAALLARERDGTP